MEVGGRTQYRTMVQGMSEATRKYRMRWEDSKA